MHKLLKFTIKLKNMQKWTRVMPFCHINSEYTQFYFKYKCSCIPLKTLLMICILFSCGFPWYLLCKIGLAIQLDYIKAPMTLQVLHPTSWRNTVWLRPHPSVVSFVYTRGNNISLQYRIHSYMIFPSRFPFFTYIRPHFASKTSVQVAATQVCMPYW